jgi:DNA-binding NarL/FixJ family response regulator
MTPGIDKEDESMPQSGEPIRVMLVDDHALFRRGVRTLLGSEAGLEVVGEAADGEEAVTEAERTMPDVILMDLNMPKGGGLGATRRIKEILPYTSIVMLTVSDYEQDLFDAIKAGAQGYLLKNVEPAELVQAVRKAYRGEATLPGLLAAKILQEFARQDPLGTAAAAPRAAHGPASDLLGEREREVLAELAAGRTNREIAGRLFISENTVRNHVKNILAKLHLANRTQAAAYAIREGLAPETEG